MPQLSIFRNAARTTDNDDDDDDDDDDGDVSMLLTLSSSMLKWQRRLFNGVYGVP